MKTIATATMCACLMFGAGVASAQSATTSGTATQGAMTSSSKQGNKMMQDCKDRTATQKGEKRNDASVSGDVADACGDTGNKTPMKKHMKKDKSSSSMSNSSMSASSPN